MSDHEAQIERINTLTAAGRTNWLGLLGYLAFAFITVLAVEDADFFLQSRQTELPLISVSIPTASFFLFAPALGAALYVYLHLHIRKVTAALTEAPAMIDGDPLERRIDPWMLNDFVLKRRHRGAIDARPMDWLVTLVTVTLIWLAGPLVLGTIWVRSWPAHNEWMTALIALCLMLSIYAGYTSWIRLQRDLDGERATITFADVLMDLAALFALMLFLALGWIKTETGNPPLENQSRRPILMNLLTPAWWNTVHPANLVGVRFSALPSGNEDPASARDAYRAGWCQNEGIAMMVCGRARDSWQPLPDALRALRRSWCSNHDLPGDAACDTHFAELDAAFDQEWRTHRDQVIAALPKPAMHNIDLRGADLQRAHLTGIDLRGSDLSHADARGAQFENTRFDCDLPDSFEPSETLCSNLQGANFGFAQLQGARFAYAAMQDANFVRARLRRANFTNARLDGARFTQARMQTADLRRATARNAQFGEAQMQHVNLEEAALPGAAFAAADMRGAALEAAQMPGAVLERARLQGAELWSADLRKADLSDTQLQGADLSDANLQQADLGGADMQRANLSEAQLQQADLRKAQLQGADLWRAQLQGADLRGANFDGADMRGTILRAVSGEDAIFGASPLHDADLRDATGLSQAVLSTLVGNDRTLLPERLRDGDAPYIPSCWPSLPDDWTGKDQLPDVADDKLTEIALLCPPGTEPQRTGTPWPLDKPPLWETTPAPQPASQTGSSD